MHCPKWEMEGTAGLMNYVGDWNATACYIYIYYIHFNIHRRDSITGMELGGSNQTNLMVVLFDFASKKVHQVGVGFIEWPMFHNCSIYLSMSGSSTKPMDWERKQIHPWILIRIHRPPQAPRQKLSGCWWFFVFGAMWARFWTTRSDIERFITF